MTTVDSGQQTYTGIDDLLVELVDGVLRVTMNRPDSLNSLTAAMFRTITSTIGTGRYRPAGQGRATRRRRSGLLIGRGHQRRRPGTEVGRRARIGSQRGQRRRAVDREPAAAGGGSRAGAVRRCRCLAGVGVRRRSGFGEGVFHARLHQDRIDARRRRVGVDRRGGRSYPRHADGTDGRTDQRQRCF